MIIFQIPVLTKLSDFMKPLFVNQTVFAKCCLIKIEKRNFSWKCVFRSKL